MVPLTITITIIITTTLHLATGHLTLHPFRVAPCPALVATTTSRQLQCHRTLHLLLSLLQSATAWPSRRSSLIRCLPKALSDMEVCRVSCMALPCRRSGLRCLRLRSLDHRLKVLEAMAAEAVAEPGVLGSWNGTGRDLETWLEGQGELE